jgi:hypothetical protein
MEAEYYDPAAAGSYGGVRTLATKYGRRKVQQWLSSQDAYTLHKPIRRIFPRRKTYSKGIHDLYQIDLVDMQHLARYNDGYRYILTCIDVFTKKAFALPLKDKRGSTVVEALCKIFDNTSLPVQLVQSDYGTEFYNHEVQKFFKDRNIKHYSSLNYDIKAAVVERFNRTLKTKMFRYFTHRNTYRWIDVLDKLLESYNNTYHSAIRMTPNQVNFDNDDIVRDRLYPVKPKPKWKFNVGDNVRISRARQVFRKGYLPQWSEEIFTIVTKKPTNPVTYGLKDYDGESIKGSFYEQELQKVEKADDVYVVEKVLNTRRTGDGKREYFVKWRGYPDKFNSWTSDVIKI